MRHRRPHDRTLRSGLGRRVTRYDRDAILNATDLAALADELLGAHRGARIQTWPCPVPTHAQTGRTPPLTVFATRWGEQRWSCHGCGASGTAIDLVMLTHGVDVRGAFQWLAARTDVRAEVDRAWSPPQRRTPTSPDPPALPDPRLDDYVASCEGWLQSPRGQGARRWLVETRGLPLHVLELNRVGFDPGARRLERPDGVPRSPGVVLPVLGDDGRAVFTQTRRLGVSDDGPRYLNCATRAASNPRLAFYRSPEVIARCVVVCEGALDALSASSAGYRSAAVLGAGLPDERIARRLAELQAPLVVAFDADAAGESGACRLMSMIGSLDATVTRLRPPEVHGDLNSWMVAAPNIERWQATLCASLRSSCTRNERSLSR